MKRYSVDKISLWIVLFFVGVLLLVFIVPTTREEYPTLKPEHQARRDTLTMDLRKIAKSIEMMAYMEGQE